MLFLCFPSQVVTILLNARGVCAASVNCGFFEKSWFCWHMGKLCESLGRCLTVHVSWRVFISSGLLAFAFVVSVMTGG